MVGVDLVTKLDYFLIFIGILILPIGIGLIPIGWTIFRIGSKLQKIDEDSTTWDGFRPNYYNSETLEEMK